MTKTGKRVFDAKLKLKVDKFSQTAMEQLFYGAFTYFGIVLVTTQPWFWPSKHWWLDFDKVDPASGHSVHSFMTDAIAAYYILYAARYFTGMLSVLLEHKRRDFWEMQLHHFVTVMLVSHSYEYGWNRVGLVGERRCPGRASTAYTVLSDALFVVFMVSFFVMRLGMFPYICWSAHMEATLYFPKGVPEWTAVVLL
eukprot:CAMPEP_0171799720 /NCGR_PEP_ID=MMETSP0991-20121206/71265_1 /TAXON_ID=483369 /ORGANISM="non described non described, Strain CCMP2098" /LENGTH=195 /DNA_ID=CAMNT_0012411119 /DNA_START=83 /DNA_END=666 /DNA_ORIENTATION=-